MPPHDPRVNPSIFDFGRHFRTGDHQTIGDVFGTFHMRSFSFSTLGITVAVAAVVAATTAAAAAAADTRVSVRFDFVRGFARHKIAKRFDAFALGGAFQPVLEMFRHCDGQLIGGGPFTHVDVVVPNLQAIYPGAQAWKEKGGVSTGGNGGERVKIGL